MVYNALLLYLKSRKFFEKIRTVFVVIDSQILTIRQIIEGARAKNFEATLLFVDFSKVYDSIHRRKMEKILLAYVYHSHIHEYAKCTWDVHYIYT